MNNHTLIPSLANMLDEVFSHETLDKVSKGFWMAPANIKEFESSFLIEIVSPGFSKEDFSIDLDERKLVVNSKKEFKTKEDQAKYSRKEFSLKNFSRQFTLPKNIKVEEIDANYNEGILTISLPKNEETKITKKIEIK